MMERWNRHHPPVRANLASGLGERDGNERWTFHRRRSRLREQGPALRCVHQTPIMKRASELLWLALPLLAAGVLSGCSLLGPLISAALPYAGLKLAFACIPEHTPVDTPSGPRPIEKLEAGDTVIGFTGKPVRILQKHSYLENPETVFLHITFGDGAAVALCGAHRVAGIRAREIQPGQTVVGRKVTAIEARRGETHSYDLLTEDAGYQINGVPVNSMIEEMHAASRKRPVRD